MHWAGVRFDDLLARAGPAPEATGLTFVSAEQPYVDTLRLAQARLADAMLAYEMDGRPLRREHGAPARNVTLERPLNGAIPDARCTPEHVERVLLNLLTNALRHTPSDGTVAVTVATAGSQARVTVEDTGEGTTPEAAQRMFDRIWRGDSARQAAGGSGLGLAIARGLVEAQGGTIWAEPRETGGASISFTLPGAGS